MSDHGTRGRIININVASEAEIAQIAEIGIQRAKKIIEYRARHGRFSSIEDLAKVPGMDKAVLRDVRGAITV